MRRDEQRAIAIDLIDRTWHEVDDGDNDNLRRLVRAEARGAAHLAIQLGLITFDEWDAIDNGERVEP